MATAENPSIVEKRKKLKGLKSKLAKLTTGISLRMKEKDSISYVRALRIEINETREEFEREYDTLEMFSCEEQTNLKESRDLTRKELDSLLIRVNEWVGVNDSSAAPIYEHGGSEITENTRSSSKKRRQLAELKLVQTQKRHELQRKIQELNNQQAEMQRELELQSVQDQLARSEFDDDSDSGSSTSECVRAPVLPGNSISSEEKVQSYVDQLEQPGITANTGSYGQKTACDAELYQGLKAMTVSVQESLNLPKPELFTFNGNSADYSKFVRNFETNIESRVNDNRLKLSYLIQFCQGDAKRSIEDCVVLPPEEGFERAKSILSSRYGKPHLVARSHVERLINGNTIRNNDIKGLMNLSLDMEKCQINLSQVGFRSDLDNSENLRKIVRRLPFNIRSKWVERASRLIEQGVEPSFDDLLTFVQERANVANTMYGHDLYYESKPINVKKPQMTPTPTREKFVTLSTSSNDIGLTHKRSAGLSCVYCREGHKLIDCPKFKLIDLKEKLNVVKTHKMCENCLNFKHSAKFCRKNSYCEVSGCKEKHHTMLHDETRYFEQSNGQSNCCNVLELGSKRNRVSLRIVPVEVENGNLHVKTYALLDEGSDVTLCSEELVEKLGAVGIRREFTITTINKSSERKMGVEVQLKVSSLDKRETLDLNKVWSVRKLPISLDSMPDRREVSKWRHLDGIDLPHINEGQVELLIGSDVPEAFWVEEERRGRRGEPYAIRSLLGWSIIGPAGKCTPQGAVNVNFQQSLSVEDQIEKLWSTDFPDMKFDCGVGMSQEDRRARTMMEDSITLENGHYKLGLPWRDRDIILPNNKPMALKRFEHLKRKLQKNEELYALYKSTMEGYIKEGYAERVPEAGLKEERRVWYLPHHPVINPKKPNKVRIVFDCAAKFRGTSLNDNLLQGPDYMNSIVGVLMRFRQKPVALVADIEAMFHQVKVKASDRNALRFLWWPNGDISKQPVEYCMNVHLFGATSSPSCAAFSLKRTARDNSKYFSDETVNTVERNFYVDDLLKSVPDEQVGIKLAKELREILSLGGFRLTKWVSNSSDVLSSIPETERAESNARLDLERDTLLEKTLGLQWYVERDCFVFDVNLQDKGFTRRGILSVASSLYDPLGFVAPVTLIPKLVLQNACRQKLGWDERIAEADTECWTSWLASLPELSKVSIERCLEPMTLDKHSTRTELHIFSDASEKAYGSAAYLKVCDASGNSKCSLIIGKSRLAPIKTLSIPRLELAAAALAVKLYQLVTQELDIEIHDTIFWTDSMIVLGYINNDKKRFKTFVANRLSYIHDATTPKDWRYVPSRLNPADLASRGFYPYDTDKLSIWLKGPNFILEDRSTWPKIVTKLSVSDDDIEVKPEVNVNMSQGKQSKGVNDLLNRYSDWNRLQRAVGWLLRFKTYLVERYLRSNKVSYATPKHFTANEIREATSSVIRVLQMEVYRDEIRSIVQVGKVPKSSSLVRLNPEYTDGLLRVGGRLQNSLIGEDAKHPIILPSSHHVTRILIRDFHERNAHMGVLHVLSLIRQNYWIVQGLRTVKSVLNRCLDCKRNRHRPVTQQMGQLPEERLIPDKAPFTYVGIDYFGPMTVKSGRRHLKRYGCLFTCLTTRAVHIEIAHSLDTDSFICALRRFVGRRGNPEKIFSDNGTNFVSGEKILRQEIEQWNDSRLAKFCQQHKINWHFNPPYAPHMGGVWERLVRSVKTALKSVIREQLLNDEALLTLVVEIEKILNDRPITQVSSDSRDPEPLSPNKLLIMRTNASFPPGLFSKHDIYCRRWWKQVQYLANLFWRRWTREYLSNLQVRQKWHTQQRSVDVNDLVLVCDEPSSRGQWPLGLVLEVSKGRDGLVRSCKVKVNGSIKVRPITTLCMLEHHVL